MTEDELLGQLIERVLDGCPNDSPDPTSGAPATGEAVAYAERALGHPLPPLLRRIYLEIGNGGIGPGEGVFDLETLVEQNPTQRDVPDREGVAPAHPHQVLFLVDWGCANLSMIDCRDPEGPIWAWEEGCRWAHGWNLRRWLEEWLDHRVTLPRGMRQVRVAGHPEEWFYSEEWTCPWVDQSPLRYTKLARVTSPPPHRRHGPGALPGSRPSPLRE